MTQFIADTKKFFESHTARIAAGIAGALLITLLILHAGIAIGARHFGDGPMRRFDADRRFHTAFFPGNVALPHGFIPNTHGAVGTITAVSLPSFTLETREGIRESVLVGTTTLIRSANATSTAALTTGAQVIVLGTPNATGQIDAKVIRVRTSSAQ